MSRFTAREIMAAAMAMKDGDKIVTSCTNYSEMEALRTQLYKIKTAMLKKHKAIAYSLYISREVIPDAKEDNYLVVVSKELTVSNAVVIGKDGTVKPLEREVPAEGEIERMQRLMLEDGKSEEDIADVLSKQGEVDFDAAASKIEQAQDAAYKGKKKKDKAQ